MDESDKFTIEEQQPNQEGENAPQIQQEDFHNIPPLVVVVQGGTRSGKSTLIKSLVKYYTNQNISTIKGPITLRNTKNQRITFYECPKDISAMVDLSKITDVALTLVDAKVGFEMETFEFMSLLKNHGFTSVMGVLTHMDEFRQNKSLNKFKKQVKKRFLKEATDKAKLFYLYGIKNNLYLKAQMHNLARYLRVMKPSVPNFRVNHPYILADRFEVTYTNSSNDPEDDALLSFYGYVRGNHFNKNSLIHINGLGDYKIDYMTRNEDPCPVESVVKKGKKKRTLKEKEKYLYAPYCNLNALEYDNNEGYVTIPDRFVTFTKNVGEDANVAMDEGVKIVRELQDITDKKAIDEQMKGELEIFKGVDYEDEADENIHFDRSERNPISKKKATDNKINELIGTYKLDSVKPDFYKETATTDINKTIYESTEDEDDIDLVDTYKYVKNPEFSLDFLTGNAKRRFITGSSIYEDGEEDNEEEPEDKTKEVAGKNPADNDMQLFLNEEYGLYEKGAYVRVDIKQIKKKFLEHFNIENPIILCTTEVQESSLGFMKIRFVKHIWHPKILKTNDPIVLSIGWRKFQTTLMYCVEDQDHKLRMIKYTPKYTACYAIAYGPLLPINTAVVGIQKFSEDNVEHFRICGTGDLLEVNQNFEVNKKLKLIGEPVEVFKKTAFIKGMFNSNLEVARYIGAKIRTVSGIRGQIKKALNIKPEGSFRATFEDKILKSDVIFMRTWNPVSLQKFYNPVLTYGKMKFLRTMAVLRKDYNLELPQNKDSEYHEVKREERVFPNLLISKSLEQSLPFKSKNKIRSAVKGKSLNYEEDDTFLLKKLNIPHVKPLKNYLTEKEKSVTSMLQRLQTIKNVKEKRTKQVAADFEKNKKEVEQKEEILKKKRNREKTIKKLNKKFNKN